VSEYRVFQLVGKYHLYCHAIVIVVLINWHSIRNRVGEEEMVTCDKL
jgi:hypothetical protein